MTQNWFLIQVSNDILSHMADDIKYIGQTTFRGSCSYEIPCEDDYIVVYSGFNNGNLFPLFIAKVNRVFLKNKNEYICLVTSISKIVKISKEFAEYELQYFPQCKTNMTEQIDHILTGKIWAEVQKASILVAWN